MEAPVTTAGLAIVIAAVLTGAAALTLGNRYRRDLARARERLAGLDRRVVETSLGSIEFCEWGAGTPVLMVHGVVGGCDVGPSWRSLVPDGYRVITPSRFGYLGSLLPGKASAALQADAFAELLDALDIRRVPVLGFSAGSTSCVQLALRHPDRVSALILVAANAPHRAPFTVAPRWLAPVIFSQPVFWALRVFQPARLARLAGTPADYELTEADRETLDAIFDSFFPLGERTAGCVFDGYVGNPEIASCAVEEITVPTLAVHAEDDPLADYEDAKAMAERIPGARFVHVDRGGHIFIHKDARAVGEIEAFIDRAYESRTTLDPPLTAVHDSSN